MGGGDTYFLSNINKQWAETNMMGSSDSLKELIRTWNIHILKGKIIIWEEE